VPADELDDEKNTLDIASRFPVDQPIAHDTSPAAQAPGTGQMLRATAPRLLFSCRSSGIVWMRIFAVCPLFSETIILVADHHLGSMSILLCEIDGRREGLLLAWES
jgi:hypothetical protein